ncbi:MAG: SDR family NAD(P)-dependent oxidoreductase [Bacteroidetes bacterium]|nr:SDR family NAD(P)-dependent oxidoreductase [Bacteroidota bacterium]
MKIENKTILITGANRGIGQALVEEALKRGAKHVYAATRTSFTHTDKRVTPIVMDVTNPSQIKEAVSKIDSLDILINNAGIYLYDDLSDPTAFEKQLAVHLYGTQGVTQAFLAALTNSKGAVVNNLSLLALAPLPFNPGYCISKAAAFSYTQSLRALVASRGIKVHAVLTGPTDTEMTKGLEIPKSSPQVTAKGIFDGVENNEEEIFPDPMSATMAEAWRNSGAKAMELQYAAMVPA